MRRVCHIAPYRCALNTPVNAPSCRRPGLLGVADSGIGIVNIFSPIFPFESPEVLTHDRRNFVLFCNIFRGIPRSWAVHNVHV